MGESILIGNVNQLFGFDFSDASFKKLFFKNSIKEGKLFTHHGQNNKCLPLRGMNPLYYFRIQYLIFIYDWNDHSIIGTKIKFLQG